jgi:hypothetical protein
MVVNVVRMTEVRQGAVDQLVELLARFERIDGLRPFANLRERALGAAAVFELRHEVGSLRAADVHAVVHGERHDGPAGIVQHVVVAKEHDFRAAARIVVVVDAE